MKKFKKKEEKSFSWKKQNQFGQKQFYTHQLLPSGSQEKLNSNNI